MGFLDSKAVNTVAVHDSNVVVLVLSYVCFGVPRVYGLLYHVCIVVNETGAAESAAASRDTDLNPCL